jgi:hypothetical protein
MRLKACYSKCLLIAATLLLTPTADAEQVPVPRIENGVARLRVVHAVNSRLPKITDQELQSLLAVMQQTVSDHFQIEVKLDAPVEVAVSDLLTAIPAKITSARKDIIYDFKTGTGDRARLLKGYEKTLREWETPLADLVAYAQPYLVQPVQKKSYERLAEALVETHLSRLKDWRARRAVDGAPMLDDTLVNEWVIWDLLGYSNMPFDVVVTNQPVISAEYEDSGLNSALRGGVSAGGTSYSKSGRYKTYSFISTFPFSAYASLPKGTSDISSRDQAVQLAGQYMAHEIGHMLMLLAHPFDNPACVMRPEPLFHFVAWAKNLDAAKCKIGFSPAMNPGAAKIHYRPEW